mmetsp:Transcript_30129/g.89363  ORF Transcript_30129/g.89363 Transcript_30129/m.89363 type:complete len:348 (-) Transcript_30129:1251-2294(-)|eukprot:CAMPEP_0175209564 /NCGR_PEP_ID=MMETSP0093-20121207/14200_1 /TAXON_ID=311494 /ORGANISM="Alexandrium monilatum, Strain CCMP3105" /LENGTH=347 /DNA_ID=CAMNT_0016502777 /DNA_START=13 /DNA_END=1056 /DNA_ORIENTATION=+
MKLKRFLLRYEPPGVGLEVENNGVTDVLHKDLWLATEVRSEREVNALVDQLIQEEPQILTKRRHRPALVQLLCRLYQISDASRKSEEAEATPQRDADAEPAVGKDDESTGLRAGQQVVLVGLRGSLQGHNGQLGTLMAARADTGEYEVHLNPGRFVKQSEHLKMRNADHIVPAVPSNALDVGQHAVIFGLNNHVDLNGCFCRVIKCHTESLRYEVRALESGLHYRMRHDNLVAIQPCPHSQYIISKYSADRVTFPSFPGGEPTEGICKPGSVVQIIGLRTATNFNGQMAQVLSYDRERGRYSIRLRDGSEKTVRTANVRPVGGHDRLRTPAGPAAIDSVAVLTAMPG